METEKLLLPLLLPKPFSGNPILPLQAVAAVESDFSHSARARPFSGHRPSRVPREGRRPPARPVRPEMYTKVAESSPLLLRGGKTFRRRQVSVRPRQPKHISHSQSFLLLSRAFSPSFPPFIQTEDWCLCCCSLPSLAHNGAGRVFMVAISENNATEDDDGDNVALLSSRAYQLRYLTISTTHRSKNILRATNLPGR